MALSCDDADTREHADLEPVPALVPKVAASRDSDDGAAAAVPTPHPAATVLPRRVDGLAIVRPMSTVSLMVPLPHEVLVAVFNLCDARTRMMTIPAVSKRWLGVCQMRRAAIDLKWAVRSRGRGCAITDAGLAGLVLRFPNLQHLNLSSCRSVTDGGLAAVAAGCPNLQRLDPRCCTNVTEACSRRSLPAAPTSSASTSAVAAA